jgi:hypothetical protein
MKTLLFLSLIFAANARAAESCSSLWIYQPYKTCQTKANGLDTSRGELVIPAKSESSDWRPGGSNQQAECDKIARRFDSDAEQYATRGVGKPTGEEQQKPVGVALYKYHCQIEAYKYPFATGPNKACGVEEDTWHSEDLGKSLSTLPGQPICLSCDNMQDAKGRLACLKNNIEQVIVQKKVSLRRPQLEAVLASVRSLIDMQNAFPKTFSVDEAVSLPKLESSLTQAIEDLH